MKQAQTTPKQKSPIMAATTTTTTTTVDPDRPPHLWLDSIPIIDLHLLSQSELYSLSKCSNSSFDLSRCDDVVIPKIDRSVFNESAGSRKQTYSRLRLAPAPTSTSSPATIHRRTPHLRPSITPVLNNVNDPEQVENSQIIHALKQLFKSNPSFDDYVAVEVEIDGNEGVFESLKQTEVGNDGNGGNLVVPESLNPVEVKTEGNVALLNSEMKRKRGRPRKHEKVVLIKPPVRKRRRRMHNDTVMKVVVYDSEMDKELLNCRGVKVDFVNLGKLEDPYGPEIRKRTEGLLTSDVLLGFLRGLKGEWGTTRKKRRVVDASDFGDTLPKGWRLSLCIKRKGGRVWVFCRRYISPSGRYFESCKDVSTYLLSVVGEENLDKPTCTPGNDCDESALKGASGNAPDVDVQEDLKTDMPVPELLNPIEVEKDGNVIVPEPLNSIEVENDGNDVVPELSNFEMRRKRGRPRKHENAVFISPPVSKRMRNDTVKKVVVYDSGMDRDIVNCKGVEIDLVNLGRLEDPYGPEIGRKTEGMLTADELLGFLRGVNGEWGTTRKKRRVVDASDFGDALPKGWRLSLGIKRKDGRVWVFCHRYISPSGRQFESCKDVSMYLLSVVGEENLGKPTCAQTNDYDDSALKGASENDADLFVQEELKTNDPVLESLNPMEGEKDRKIYVSESLNPIEVENGGNVVPELTNSERRRKRGRPRKNENAVSISPLVTKRMHNDSVKKVVVYDTDKDREIVNCRGVEVNLVNLGRLEDPYAPEIRTRTEGMLTADELLGFLRGLNGEWGTTRKKRRVVDASDFGDALPIGWRLSLCIKRKDGRVWLFCRRYISPSGRQFESCKDISGYLLSIVGEENSDKPSCAHSNDSDDSALKIASVNAADIYVREDLKKNILVHSSSALPISLPTGFENQVTSGIGDRVVVQEVYKCLKCFIIFEGKINLLDHQALAHKDEGSQLGSAIPDWSIVIGGIFECKFCQKTFYEKNQYNGHIGTHVANESKTSEASAAAPAAEKFFDSVSISAERNDATETHDAHFGDTLIPASSRSDHKIISVTESKIDEVVHDLNMDGDVLVEESGDDIGNNCNVDDNASDVFVIKSDDRVGNNCNAVDDSDSVVKSDFCLGHEASVSVNEINGKFKSSGRAIDAVDAKSECMSGVQTTIICEKKGYRENINDIHVCSSSDKLASEKEKAVNTESSSGVFHGRIGLDEDCLAEPEKLSDSESLFLFSPNKDRFKTVNGSMIPSKNQESPKKIGFDATVGRVTHGSDENRFSCGIASSKHDAPYKVNSCTLEYYKETEPVSNEKFHGHNNVNNASLDKSGGVNLDSFHNFKNNGSINNKVASFGSSQGGINAGVTRFNTEKQLNFSSPVPPGNQQAFDFHDDVTGLYDSAHGSSQKGLLDHFCVAETSDDIFGNKLYSTPLDDLKFDEGIHELSLAFGNPHPHALYADKMSGNEQKKDINCSVVPSKIENPFDVQTDLSMVNNSMVQDLNRGSESVGRSFSLSRNSESRTFQHNGNTGYSGRTWEDPRLDEFRSSDHNKFMIGSGSNQHRHNEAGPRDIWKSAERNQLQSGFVHPPVQTQNQTQSPSFHSFDIMSAKAEDGVFRLDERYNVGMSVGRSEPVEFRFLAGRSEHSPHALQGGSRAFPFNNRMEQAFDSNFWMGNNGMMPNMGGRNVVTSVCAWCRNQFQMPAMAMHPESQGGAGSLCPTCSAGFSGQVNML